MVSELGSIMRSTMSRSSDVGIVGPRVTLVRSGPSASKVVRPGISKPPSRMMPPNDTFGSNSVISFVPSSGSS